MALNIKSQEADQLARELAAETGESITEAVTRALRERLERKRRSDSTVEERVHQVRAAARRLPVIDRRSPEEIIGYDEHGLPR